MVANPRPTSVEQRSAAPLPLHRGRCRRHPCPHRPGARGRRPDSAALDPGLSQVSPAPITRASTTSSKTFVASLDGERIEEGAIACAGYVLDDGGLDDGSIITVNLPWPVSPQDIRERLGFRALHLVNDFEAVAHAAAEIDASEVLHLSGPASAPSGPTLVVGPGTGLGAAVWIPAPGHPVVLATEAGQAALTAGNELEMALLAELLREHDHVPVEYALSGPGLLKLHTRAVRACTAVPPAIANPARSPPPRCRATIRDARASLEVFCGLLGSTIGDLALLYGVQGGIYLAGGILPQIRDFLLRSSFVERFLDKGAMRPALERIPVKLVEHGRLGVIGAAQLVSGSAARESGDARGTVKRAGPPWRSRRAFRRTTRERHGRAPTGANDADIQLSGGRDTMKYRRSVLSAAIVACLGFAAQAQAQDATTQEQAQDPQSSDEITELDTITVVGIRASLKKSLDTKRDADAVVEALTAEDIGEFPNTNVAEAMAQIPGVTIDRRFGQGERVSIDGTDPSLNLTFLDGHPVAQAIWLFGEQPNRGFDQTQIAAEMIGRLEIYKSPEARLPEGSLGGTVLMHTRKPLDLDANTFSGTLGYNYNQQASEGEPSISGLYSWKNPQETFGVTIAAQHYEEQVDRQGSEIFGYVPASTFPNVTGIDPDALVPNFINVAWFQQTRERDSVALNLQFKPTDDLEFNLSGLYIKEDFANYNQSVYNFLSLTPDEVDALTVGPNGIVTGGHSGANSVVFYDNNARASEPTTKGLDLKVDYSGDRWGLSGQVGQSKADNDLKQWFIEPAFTGGFSWDINRGITFDDSDAARDPANWVGEGFFGNHGIFATESEDTYGQIDFSKQFDSVFNELQVGVRRHEHTEDFSLNVYGIPGTGDLSQVGTIGFTDIEGFAPDHGRHLYVGRNNVIDWVNNAPPNFANPDAASFINNTYSIEQTNTAAYAQLNFSADRLRGNFGLRYVRSEIESTAFELGSDVPTLPPQPEWLVTRNNDDDYLLPSLTVVYDLSEDVLLRFAAAKVVAWAPYNQMAPNTFLNDTTLTGSGGNAGLEAYESTNFNLSAEWYFAEESVLAASLFYKDISNFIESDAQVEVLFNSISDDVPPSETFADLVAAGRCTADGFCNYDIIRPRNAGSGKVQGINLSFQTPFDDTGFGITANYTYADGETAAGNDLPYQSENQFSVSPYYEKGPFSARITYGWRSEYLAGGFVAGAPPVSVDEYSDLGASVGWRFTDNLELSFDAQNLLDEEYFQYFGDKFQPANRYTTGRRYQVSLQFKF